METKKKPIKWTITSLGLQVEENRMLKWLSRELGQKKNGVVRDLIREKFTALQPKSAK